MKVLRTLADGKLALTTTGSSQYQIQEVATMRLLVGGEHFATRREAEAFARQALATGYQTHEP